ncbi:hypothetical protein N7541_011562 [Penicillium brevicompactum]|uniref:Ams2/SPT21 N-terminal domain-containing protein n=1 Tax=Penicillium brevicompactum TaxID=5074 RepID=A0A9W9UIH9_PENBR|nr:hypothetical protein N7541_011562 [Penicillium brevicompactum]
MSDEMESQDGIDVRPMRLKVLYTFDNENKTNCLARWPHVLDLQTASLDENTTVGVIELKTCIQAIVSASPELVGQIGKDYTVYAYDYSEFDTPLVGQGMLSWVLANSSSAEASASKTMITGRVCKNPLAGLFSKGAQETLEVKLRLVPVPTTTHNDFDTQSWTNFVRQNPALMEQRSQSANDRVGSPMNQSGIERFHQLLSEGSTPREFASFPSNASARSASPSHSYAASGVSTPAHYQSYNHKQSIPHSDMIRPSSSASMRDCDNQTQLSHNNLRRGSIQSGYGSGDEENTEAPPRKRAKVYQASWPGKSGANIERQPSSLRVAASTAASVRIHRPTPVNPALATEHSHDEPVRPPTPMSRPSDFHRRSRPTASLLRESSTNSVASCPDSYASPYAMSDDMPTTDAAGPSPEDSRYQGLFEQSFSMPSSPPVFDGRLHNRSSPVLPTMTLDTDSGFMSAGLDELLGDETATLGGPITQGSKDQRSVRTAVQASSPVSTVSTARGTFKDPVAVEEHVSEQPAKEAVPPLARANSGPPKTRAPSHPQAAIGRRPTSSSGAQRIAPKPLAPAPRFFNRSSGQGSEITASDPVIPTVPTESAPPAPVDITFLRCKTDSSNPQTQAKLPPPTKPKANSKTKSNGRARLETALANGEIPPYCENCGSIETPSWRRAWVKEVCGDDVLAEQMMISSQMLFWEAMERNDQNKMIKFKIFKRGMELDDESWSQMLFCNPCGLWLHKFKNMRPEHKWTKSGGVQNGQKSKKRPSKTRADGPLNACPASRTRSKAAPKKASANTVAASSPAHTDLSSVHPEGDTPHMDDDDEDGATPDDRSRFATDEPRDSEEPHPASLTPGRRRSKLDTTNTMHRVAKSSPVRRPEARANAVNTTPKSVRRSLFQDIQKDGPLKELDASMVNSCSPRRSPRIALTKDDKLTQKENAAPIPRDELDDLFESASIGFDSASPTPRRRNPRLNAIEKRAILGNSPSLKKRKDLGIMSPARLSAERLQRIQSLHEHSPRSQKASAKPDVEPATLDDSLSLPSFEGMMLDIFDENDQTNFQLENAKFAGENWADWLPQDYVPPVESPDADNQPADDLLKSLFADTNDKDFQASLLPFNFNDVGVPDSGFFSSDAVPDVPKAQGQGTDATSPV